MAVGPRPSLGKVVRLLEESDDPAWKNLGAVMRSVSEMRLARLCFSPSGGQQIDAQGWTTVFTLGGLTLPDTTTGREDYSYEQRLSVALLYLVSQFARRLMNTIDRTAPKAIFLDEAWAITSTPEGAKLVPEVSRMGRSRNTALVLISQNAGDLLSEQVTNCISSVFAFRSSERAEVANVLSLLGVEPSEEHKAILRASATASASSVTSTTARAASASISYPKNYGTGSTQTRHEPAGLSRRQPPSKNRRIQEPPEMAEPRPRAGKTGKRRRPARALLLTERDHRDRVQRALHGPLGQRRAGRQGRAGSADRGPLPRQRPAAHAAPAATAANAATSCRAARAAARNQLAALVTPAQPTPGSATCPGVGDIGGLIGLCQAGSGVVGDLNNICTSGAPAPELATSGIDSMITTPGGPTTGKTLYDNYGMAGQYWASTGLNCSQMTSSIGNNVAGMVFDMAKSLDRVTITVYQSAAGANILSWLSGSVDQLITSLGNAIYFPFLAPVVIIAAIWLAWQGLVRKRATRTFEGTIWMVIACAAAIWLIGRPADFTNVGTTVSNGVTSVLNTAFSKLPATTGSNCLPVQSGDPQSVTANYSFTSGNGLVDQNANELWTVLVCKPWLDGELGTTQYAHAGDGGGEDQRREPLRQAAAVGAGGRGQRAAGHDRAHQRQAGHLQRHRAATAANQPVRLLAVPG